MGESEDPWEMPYRIGSSTEINSLDCIVVM